MFDTWLKRIVLVMAGVLLAAVFAVVIVAALTPLKSKSSDIFKKVGDECSPRTSSRRWATRLTGGPSDAEK